jgi:hypothetical protein
MMDATKQRILSLLDNLYVSHSYVAYVKGLQRYWQFLAETSPDSEDYELRRDNLNAAQDRKWARLTIEEQADIRLIFDNTKDIQ